MAGRCGLRAASSSSSALRLRSASAAGQVHCVLRQSRMLPNVPIRRVRRAGCRPALPPPGVGRHGDDREAGSSVATQPASAARHHGAGAERYTDGAPAPPGCERTRPCRDGRDPATPSAASGRADEQRRERPTPGSSVSASNRAQQDGPTGVHGRPAPSPARPPGGASAPVGHSSELPGRTELPDDCAHRLTAPRTRHDHSSSSHRQRQRPPPASNAASRGEPEVSQPTSPIGPQVPSPPLDETAELGSSVPARRASTSSATSGLVDHLGRVSPGRRTGHHVAQREGLLAPDRSPSSPRGEAPQLRLARW